jgi:hypothetical protein
MLKKHWVAAFLTDGRHAGFASLARVDTDSACRLAKAANRGCD